jgi:mannose/fructose/N-acetylgalactosamine-specific phosphotransferase system component IID
MASDILFNVGINSRGYQQGMNKMQQQTDRLKSTVTSLASALGVAFGAYQIINGIKSTTQAFMAQERAERRLEQITKQVTGASNEQINSLKTLASELQKTGVIGK